MLYYQDERVVCLLPKEFRLQLQFLYSKEGYFTDFAMVIFEIDDERCKGCGLCIDHCPRHLLSLSPDLNSKGYHPIRINGPEACTGCLNCATMCPDVAISIEWDRESKPHDS